MVSDYNSIWFSRDSENHPLSICPQYSSLFTSLTPPLTLSCCWTWNAFIMELVFPGDSALCLSSAICVLPGYFIAFFFFMLLAVQPLFLLFRVCVSHYALISFHSLIFVPLLFLYNMCIYCLMAFITSG